MFTGIIQAVGAVRNVERIDGDIRLHVNVGNLAALPFALGDSVSVNGVCLTVVSIDAGQLAFDVSVESLSLTSLGAIVAGASVNLEPAATPTTALGGHIVSGHVDTMAIMTSRENDARSVRMAFELPDAYARYAAPKGSICIDGVSLTVNTVVNNTFAVNIVPHTLTQTIMDSYQPGIAVNIEIDVIARYVERLLQAGVSNQALAK
jgi:riboflavin synthase